MLVSKQLSLPLLPLVSLPFSHPFVLTHIFCHTITQTTNTKQACLPTRRIVAGVMVDGSQQLLAAANLEVVTAIALQEVGL